jgi:VanZ family protein
MAACLSPHASPQVRKELANVTRKILALRIWLPVVLWIVIIALESVFGSSANTSALIESLAVWLFGYTGPERFEIFHHVLRKCGHFLGYGILGFLWYRAFLQAFPNSAHLRSAALAVLCAFFIALLDEWHQSFSRTRTGQFGDVMLDSCGAIVLVSLAIVTAALRRKNIASSG